AARRRREDRLPQVVEAVQAGAQESLVLGREVVVDARVDLVAVGRPGGIADEVVARARAREVRLRPEVDELRRGRIEASARDAVVRERLARDGVADDTEPRVELAAAFGRRGDGGLIGLLAPLAPALPGDEEERLVPPDRAAEGGAE